MMGYLKNLVLAFLFLVYVNDLHLVFLSGSIAKVAKGIIIDVESQYLAEKVANCHLM